MQSILTVVCKRCMSCWRSNARLSPKEGTMKVGAEGGLVVIL